MDLVYFSLELVNSRFRQKIYPQKIFLNLSFRDFQISYYFDFNARLSLLKGEKLVKFAFFRFSLLIFSIKL